MSKTLIVNNTPFEYPEQGEPSPWGEPATGWASEVTKVLNSVNGPSDIIESASDIVNSATNAAIDALYFNPLTVRSFSVRGNISRYFVDGVGAINTAIYQEVILIGLYNTQTGTWTLQEDGIGDAEISFDVTDSGQLVYSTSTMAGTGTYTAIMKFRGVGILTT
jgi:hypothetical protein